MLPRSYHSQVVLASSQLIKAQVAIVLSQPDSVPAQLIKQMVFVNGKS